MAELLLCDTCGAASPNPKTHLHDANHWHHVEVKTDFGNHSHPPIKYLVCTDCMHKGVMLSHEGIAQEKQSAASPVGVPDELPDEWCEWPGPYDNDDWRDYGYMLGWNACRDAMLAASKETNRE